MSIEGFLAAIGAAIKFPFFQAIKLIVITPLNLIPTPIAETFGIQGFGDGNRPDLREFHISVRGSRRLHLGSALIAYLRGAIVRRYASPKDTRGFLGVYSEDFQAIQAKWTY